MPINTLRILGIFFGCSLLVVSHSAIAASTSPKELLDIYARGMKAENPKFQGFSAKNGEQFYMDRHGQDWSCASCHTNNPASIGSHVITKKVIQPLAPSVNSERFTDQVKVDKWFKRNCNDVLKRECTTQEKGDVITYLLTVKNQ